MITRHLALLLAKVAPLLGAGVVVASIEATSANTSMWTELWRIGMSLALGVFITLVGMIYQNLNRRLEVLERESKEGREATVPRKEYDNRHDDLVNRLNRIENAIITKRDR